MRVNHEARLRVTVIDASGVVVDPATIEMYWQVGTAPEQPLTPVRIATGVYEATVTAPAAGRITWRVVTSNPNIEDSRTEWVLP
jgi:hypothetical protein